MNSNTNRSRYVRRLTGELVTAIKKLGKMMIPVAIVEGWKDDQKLPKGWSSDVARVERPFYSAKSFLWNKRRLGINNNFIILSKKNNPTST